MMRIIPKGNAIMVTQSTSPIITTTKPTPAVTNLPNKAKIRPTSAHTILNGNRMRLKSILNI